MNFRRLGGRVIQSIKERRNAEPAPPKDPAEAEQITTGSVVIPWFKNQLRDLCQATALHGYSQIVREGYNPLERTLWVLAVSTAFVTAVVLLWISWTWNAETPTVTVIESTNYATWNLPFPAVTICNLNKISASKALERAQAMSRPQNMSAEELAGMFRLFLHVDGLAEADEREYRRLHDILLENNLENVKMGEFAAPCSAMFERCLWKGTQWRCDTLFRTTNSTEGLCCSFNYFGARVRDYEKKSGGAFEPRRVTASGYQTGLSLILNPHVEDYFTTDIATTGFKILIHNSYDFPDENGETRIVHSRTETFLAVLPIETYSTEYAMELDPASRNCFGYNELRMHVMQRYSYSNCMIECSTDQIFKRCRCVPYDLPNNGTLPNCEMKDVRCLQQNLELFRSAIPGRNNLSVTKVLDSTVPSPCRCLPSCEMVQYSVDMITSEMNRTFSNNSVEFFKDIKLQDQSAVHIYFSDLVSTRYRKDIYQNWLGVLASFGGILGLFLGFSIITGFEVVYFFTIRVLFDVCMKSRKK
ncbi:pickpocket 16 [Culex quinquefasciatus]|uniref:Pickpocket 16 n=1 Tax=Culex quinquefasciatus TaxID=7176 RepID=B0WX52_CULQU|nr:pickpocket 16 [Culex quinquefasciatus]|eukprot:XP_001861974.1 pickpocket 16 [Culex quinquefasciatus]